MKIKLCPIRDNKQTEYHVLDDSRLVLDGIVYDIAKGAKWPNAREESGGNICEIIDGVPTILYRYGKGGAPSDCGPFEVAPDGFDATGLPVISITAQSAEEVATKKAAIEASAQKAALEAELEALDADSVRPLRAIMAKTASKDDEAKLAEIEAKAKVARDKLAASTITEIKGGKA